jgi:hypothetical protein
MMWRSKKWLGAVAQIPCVFCGRPAQVAHRNQGKGMGLKCDDCQTAALCPDHHHEIDNGKTMTREQRRARMDEAIVLTLTEMVKRGLIGPSRQVLR